MAIEHGMAIYGDFSFSIQNGDFPYSNFVSLPEGKRIQTKFQFFLPVYPAMKEWVSQLLCWQGIRS